MKASLKVLLLVCFIGDISQCYHEYYKDWTCDGFECGLDKYEEGVCSQRLRCDGWPDCSDGSDERNCKPICSSNFFQCTGLANSTHCVAHSSVCDGKIDCEDGSDEINSQCENFFACEQRYTVTFLPVALKCDGFKECENDERGCTNCPDEKRNRCDCNQLQNFTCAMGSTCYNDSDRCDGKYDCVDWTDEWDCTECTNVEYPNRCDFNIIKGSAPKCSRKNKGSPYVACFKETERCDGKYDCGGDTSDEWNCTNNCFGNTTNRCACNKANDFTCTEQPCFSEAERCDGVHQCSDASDEWNCTTCPIDKPTRCNCNTFNDFTCEEQPCFASSARCDGRKDCEDFSDEWNCTSCQNEDYPWRCACNKANNFTCEKQVSCYGEEEKCNGVNDCGDWTDEINCTECSNGQLNSCACRTYDSVTCFKDSSCYNNKERCNNYQDCSDGSDEMNCTCPEGAFACGCYKSNPVTCTSNTGCIPFERVNDWHIDCEDKSDEPLLISVVSAECGSCSLLLFKLESFVNCDLIGFPTCDNSTCISIPAQGCGTSNCSNVICTSHCQPGNKMSNCDEFFQCEDGGIILTHQFCDGNMDCSDESDEINDARGFKCATSANSTRKCVLPEANLYDEAAQCHDKSDLCLFGNASCFKCFSNGMNIASRQVCDGFIDCDDLSDECLCYNSFNLPVCQELFSNNNPDDLQCSWPIDCAPTSIYTTLAQCTPIGRICPDTICRNKYGKQQFTWCDGIPECKYVQDECNCPNPPKFCTDPCRDYLPMNDRYCDGVYDPAWVYINDSRCPRGFDERDCPRRFYCEAQAKISIDISRICDGKVDCDDGSDEHNCTQSAMNERVFSSDNEMVSAVPLRVAFWVMGVATMIGNLSVILTTVVKLRKSGMNDVAIDNHILILNLSLADLLMGFYLLIIAVKSVQFSGVYGLYDYEWRTSATCTAAGILAIISSEASCFFMTILTSYRLFTIVHPIKSRISSIRPWQVATFVAWSISILLAMAPTFRVSAHYFVHEIWSPGNIFSRSDGPRRNDVTNFACRLASLTNTTIPSKENNWESTLAYLRIHFPQFSPKGEIGYYGETSVCMPRFYVTYGDIGWEFSFAIITINFISFTYVVIGYIVIYRMVFNRKIRSSKNDDKSNAMQKRIARLIATDCCCWIPICVSAYLKLGGVYISPTFYVVSAAILLPINSALNPFLYSSLIDKIREKISPQREPYLRSMSTNPSSFGTSANLAGETNRVNEIIVTET